METVFALDIGTRVVIGLVMQKVDSGYKIIASSRAEHAQRAMYDGQVHDVEEVARVVQKVKHHLEKKSKSKLRKVAVAAAGRALCTEDASVTREEVLPISWEKQDVLSLEMEAVQKAMNKISANDTDHNFFYCVGYSTVKFLLEDQPITSLIGQKGKKVELTVIATFLPRTVVDGLIGVLTRAGLEMTSLTLEPIAAGQAAIPADMRRLNLALVDIGAGTADIALTKEGSFFSYGMVPMAGDEVTEAICAHYLLDFQEGERVKKKLSEKEEIEINNFFGEKIPVAKQEILDVISPTVKTMAERIGQEILLLNQKSPQAIILVGGGSLTPSLGDRISETMKIPRNRIGVQVRERISHVSGHEDVLFGSDVITPIGIGMTALDGKGLHFYSVSINDTTIPLFELQLATVAEALLAAGIQPRSFLGRPGAALVYEVHGELKVMRGGLGKPAKILVNDKEAMLDQRLCPDDRVTFIPSEWGEDAKAQIKDVVSIPESKKIIWNGKEEEFKPVIYMDQHLATETDWIKDGSKIRIRYNETLEDLLSIKELTLDNTKITITINDEQKVLSTNLQVRVNDQLVKEDCIIRNRDRIEVIDKEITLQDLKLQAQPMVFTVNGEEFLLPPQEVRIRSKGQELSSQDKVIDKMELRVEGFHRKPILSELFPYLNLTEKALFGSRLEMLVNGNKAEFTTELHQGDRIMLGWKQE